MILIIVAILIILLVAISVSSNEKSCTIPTSRVEVEQSVTALQSSAETGAINAKDMTKLNNSIELVASTDSIAEPPVVPLIKEMIHAKKAVIKNCKKTKRLLKKKIIDRLSIDTCDHSPDDQGYISELDFYDKHRRLLKYPPKSKRRSIRKHFAELTPEDELYEIDEDDRGPGWYEKYSLRK